MNRSRQNLDLENFPSNQMASEMLRMVSAGWYDKSYVGKWLFEVMGMEMEEAAQFFEELRLQVFPETATWGLGYHEQKYGIPINPGQDLETKRTAVLKARDSKLPMNPARLEANIRQMYKREAVIKENAMPYTFILAIGAGDEELNLEDLVEYVNRVKPSHISYILSFERQSGLIINVRNSIHEVELPMTGEIYSGGYPDSGLPAVGGV